MKARLAEHYRHAHWRAISLAGLVGVSLFNILCWQKDRALARSLLDERSLLPALSIFPSVSVLVAAWNEQAMIERHIQSFLKLDYRTIELIVCAGGEDCTYELAMRYAGPHITVLRQEKGEGKQRALARCLRVATGEILYLTDADCVFEDEALLRLVAPLADGETMVATGSSRPLDEQMDRVLPMYLWAAGLAVDTRRPLQSSGLLGRNAVVAREAIDRIGGLDFEAPTGTDYRLARRLLEAGFSIRFVRESVVASAFPECLGEYRRKQSRWLRNLLTYRARPDARGDVRATIATIGTGLGMLIAPLLAVPGGPMILVPWSMLLAHAVASKVRYQAFAAVLEQRRMQLRVLLALLPLTLIDFAIWASPLIDLLSRRRRGRW